MSLSPSDILDIDYLKQNSIAKVLEKGLAHLYEEKPKFPIDFFAKWLLNYSSMLQNEQSFLESISIKGLLKEEYLKEQAKNQLIQQQQQQQIEKEENIDKEYYQKIINEEFHSELLTEDFANFLETRKKLTGVYIGVKDFPHKPINDEEEDEKAHIDSKKEKIIQYIGASKSHKQLMLNKTISAKPEESITAGVFRENKIQEEDGQQQQAQVQQQQQHTYVYIPDLSKEMRIQYFRFPKLGAFIAFPMKYFSYLKEEFSNDFLSKKWLYLENLEKWELDKATKIQEYTQEIERLQDDIEQQKLKQTEYNIFIAEYPQQPQEPEPLYEQKEYVVCADTMGQDRQISQEDITYLENIIQLFAQNAQATERRILKNDVDLQIVYYKAIPEDLIEELQKAELGAEEEAKLQYESLKEIREKEYQYMLDCAKLDIIKALLGGETLMEHIFYLKKYRILKFPQIMQNIFYILGYKREEINIENTHILNWKKVKELITEDFIFYLQQYTHKGCKNEYVEYYQSINRITQKMQKYNQQEVDDYNIGYGKLFRWLVESCRLRKVDIEIRRQNIQENQIEIEKKQQEIAAWNVEKNNKMLENQQEDPDNFNAEEWSAKWELENPIPVAPEQLLTELDADYLD